MKKSKMRLIAAFLAAIIAFEALPVEALAIEWSEIFGGGLVTKAAEQDEGNPIAEDIEEEEVTVIGEINSLRDISTKQFRLSNGTVAAVEYETDVHYEDENGEWQPIDNSLTYESSQDSSGISLFSSEEETDDVQDTDGYTTKKGKVNFKFAKNANQKNLVRIQQGDYKLSFALQDRNKNKSVEIQKGEEKLDDGSLASQMTAPNVYSTVNYNNIQDDIDLQYITSGSDLKENIIINKAKDSYSFTFDVKAKGLTMTQEEDGTISLRDTNSNELVYSMPAMYMTDDAGAQSDAITYSLKQKNKKKYELTITADASWINASERQFPVTIDPTLNTQNTGTGLEKTEIFNYYASKDGTAHSGGDGFLGYDSQSEHTYRQIVQFKNLPSLPRGSVIVDAKMYYAQKAYDSCGMSTLCIAAKEVNVDESKYAWGAIKTWSNLPEYSSTVLDYKILSSSTTNSYVDWDITSLVKKRYQSNSSNIPSYSSFALVTYDESVFNNTHCAKVKINQSNSKGYFTNGQPIIQITYRDTRGIEDYYTNTSQSIGQAGTGYIGDYNDQLTLVKNDLTNTGSVMNFVLSHVYNSSMCYANFTADAQMHTKKYSGMNIGRGWRLSIQETVVKLVIGDTTYYVYSDGDGTEHYFYYDSTKKKYVDEDGLNLTLSFWTDSSNNYEYSTIEDKKGNQKVFINGYLTKIQDAYQNKIFLLYNDGQYADGSDVWKPKPESSSSVPQNRVSGIVQINNGKSKIDIAILNYGSDGYLTDIKDKAGRTTYFTYSDDQNGGAKNLATIEHPDGTTAEYKYQSNGFLIDAYDAESKNGVQYGYNYIPKLGVLYVTEYARIDDTHIKTGAKLSIGSSETNRTFFRDYGADGERETADDIITHVTFDNAGRTINTTSYDYTSQKIYGVDSSAYTTNSTSNSSTNNRVKADVAIGLEAMNLLYNTSGESGTDGTANYWTYTGSGEGIGGAVRTDSATRTGARGFKIYMNPANHQAGVTRSGSYYQTITLQAGTTYSFSGYVKTTNSTIVDNSKPKAYLQIADSNGNELTRSKAIDYKTPSEIEDGWERLSVTFTPQTTGSYRAVACIQDFGQLSYWDDFQLEAGDAASSYNMVNDGGFEVNNTWSYSGTNQGYSSADKKFGAKSMRMVGSPTTTAQCWQSIPVNQIAENTYVISGWAKANSVPDVKSDTITDRFFGLQATLHYTDGTKEGFLFSFCADLTDWQYLSGIIVPKKENSKKTIETIAINCVYNKNANVAYFDNICLKKEPVQTYTYDSEGNLTAINQTGTASSTSKYQAGTADILEDKTGNTTYTYEHNAQHDVTSVTNDNVKMSLNHDAVGNTTGTTLVYTGTDTSLSAAGKIITSTATYSDDGVSTQSQDGNYLTSQTDSSGITTTYKTNVNTGLVTDSTLVTDIDNGTGITTSYAYDAKNDRQTMMYIAGQQAISYSYAQGNLASIRRGGYLPNSTENMAQNIAQFYSFTYDEFGNKTSTKVGNITLAEYEYAPNNGNLIKTTYYTSDNSQNTVELVYDIFDRVYEEKYNGVVKYRYVYNGEGDLAEKIEVDADDKIVNRTGYEYDGLGRLIHSWEDRADGNNLKEVQRTEHIYDDQNRIESQSWSFDGGEGRSETYTYSQKDGTLQTMKTANDEVITFGYDALKRLQSITGTVTGQTYTYRDREENNQTTTQISEINYTGVTDALKYSYTYDAVGNLSSIKQNDVTVAEYTYDAQGQLISENLPTLNVRYEYVYDTCYNIRQVKTYRNGSSTPEITTYEYGNTDWIDLLTGYNGQAITYDNIGNPLTYNNGTAWTFTWQGAHDLATATANGKSISYHYDMDGVRDSKTVNGVTHEYITQGGNVSLERWNDGEAKSLEFIYDNGGAPYSVIYTHGGTSETYYYILNQQGDVVRIVDGNGNTKAEYTYDAWGNILNVSNAQGSNIGTINPIRYRGYYYDTELNMYYLQSRYYDPVVKRMLCADDESIISGASLNNNNLFAYCDNNPVNRADVEGDIWNVVAGAVVGAACSAGTQILCNVVSGEKLTKDVGSAALSGALTGAINSIPGVGTFAQMTVNALAAGWSEYRSQDKNVSKGEKVYNIAVAAVGAGVGACVDKYSPTKTKQIKESVIKAGKKTLSIGKNAVKASKTVASRRSQGLRRVGAGIKTCGKIINRNMMRAYKSVKQTRAQRWTVNLKATAINIHINSHRWLINRFRKRSKC